MVRALVDKMWAQLREYLSKMSRGNKIKLAVLFAVVIVLAIITVSILTRVTWATLHNATDMAEAGQIRAALIEMNVPNEIDGLRIMVPEGRVSELRAVLSAEGILGPMGLDQDIMGQAAGFAVTDAHARELYDAQLSENIRRMIMMNPRIVNAMALVRQGETSPFRAAHGVRAPHAAVMLAIRGGDRLSNQEAQAIADIIRGAVPGINYENIFIADSNGNSYRVGDGITVDAESELAMRIMMQNALTEQIRLSVEQQLMPVFGINNIRITPNVRLGWDRVTREQIEFAPPVAGELQGMHRSAHDTWEAARSDDLAIGIPGTDSNELGTAEYPFGTLADGELYMRRISERNYEINQTITVIDYAQGDITALSIAVLINADAIEGDFSAEVADLVAFGLGTTVANVTVQSIPFSYVDDTMEQMFNEWQEMQEQQRMRELIQTIIRYTVILLLGIMTLLLIRTIVKTLNPPPEPDPLLVTGGGVDYLADDDYDDAEALMPEYDALEEMDLLSKLPGLEQIERFIDKDPAAVAQLLRNWLTDE